MAGQKDFQQGSHCHRKTWINILLGILQLLLSCLQYGSAQLPGLIRLFCFSENVEPNRNMSESSEGLKFDMHQVSL